MKMTTKQIPLTCPGHTRPVVDLAFSDLENNDSYFLISGCKDGKPMLRHGETGDWIGTFEGHKGAVWGATLNSNASLAATASADFTVKLWNAVSGTEQTTFTHNHIAKTVDFSTNPGKLLTGSNEKKMRIFDINSPDKDADIIDGLTSNPKACLWYNNDQTILSGADEKLIKVYDARTLSLERTITLEKPLNGMQLTRDKTILCVASGDQAIFYDTESLKEMKRFSMSTDINSVALHPNMSCFAAGGQDFLMYKYDYNTGLEQEASHGHFGPVHCVRFSPDGEIYASGSEDGTLRLWQNSVGKTYGLWKAQNDEEEQKNGGLKPNNTSHCNEISVEG